ncbi:MAG: hypothetical protein DPW21_09030 [Anaerolineae bacterium]|nr:hypothetical protein [Anaerolineae bacterium]
MIENPLDRLEFDSERTPFDYLEFARKDLEGEGETRNIINAVGNAKRALHLQVDTICTAYGYKSKSRDFPPKLIFLRDLGIVAPKVIEKINKTRNRIEHDYYVPTIEEAYDFIDIVELFLYATFAFVAVFPNETLLLIGDGNNEYEVEEETGLPMYIKFTVEKNKGKLSLYDSPAQVDQEEGLILSVDVGQREYFEWIRKLFAQIFFLPL